MLEISIPCSKCAKPIGFGSVLQALGSLVFASSLLIGLRLKLVAVMLLARGIYASIRARMFLRKLTRAG